MCMFWKFDGVSALRRLRFASDTAGYESHDLAFSGRAICLNVTYIYVFIQSVDISRKAARLKEGRDGVILEDKSQFCG